MAGLYVDTSALGRVLPAEPDAAAIQATIARYDERWSSELLIVELRRLGAVTGTAEAAKELLEAVHLAPLARSELERASQLEPLAVRSLDAIHLEAAVRLRGAGRISAVLRSTSSSSSAANTTGSRSRHRVRSLPATSAPGRGRRRRDPRPRPWSDGARSASSSGCRGARRTAAPS